MENILVEIILPCNAEDELFEVTCEVILDDSRVELVHSNTLYNSNINDGKASVDGNLLDLLEAYERVYINL